VVLGLAFVNAVSFVVGAVVGEAWVRARLGRLQTAQVLSTVARTAAAGLVAAAVAYAVTLGVPDSLSAVPRSWLELLLGTLLGGAVAVGAMAVLRVPELRSATSRVWRR
jgi:putative peptidoglycan lipid II flippase